MMQTLKIKNMVCDRCITTVEQSLTALGAEDLQVELGEASFTNELEIEKIEKELSLHGFELLKESKEILIEKMKLFMQGIVADTPISLNEKLSVLISREFAMNYVSLSKLFSQHEGLTVERYFLLLKIERAKELIQYDKLTFSEIADLLDYASINHFSKQFKTLVGTSLSEYKHSKPGKRKAKDKIV